MPQPPDPLAAVFVEWELLWSAAPKEQGYCTLADFLADNADGLDEDERADIVAAVTSGAEYCGGGGAAPVFYVRRVHQRFIAAA